LDQQRCGQQVDDQRYNAVAIKDIQK